jgi:aarF domain-containing kinase
MAFVRAMQELFEECADIYSPEGINLDMVLKQVLQLARRHHVNIDSSYASLVISVCVIVGFATALDPRVNLMDAATPTLLAYALTGKAVGRLYN